MPGLRYLADGFCLIPAFSGLVLGRVLRLSKRVRPVRLLGANLGTTEGVRLNKELG